MTSGGARSLWIRGNWIAGVVISLLLWALGGERTDGVPTATESVAPLFLVFVNVVLVLAWIIVWGLVIRAISRATTAGEARKAGSGSAAP